MEARSVLALSASASDGGQGEVSEAVALGLSQPDQDGNGILDVSDLESVLARWESGAALDTEVNDVLALLYWREQVDEQVLLDVLQRHGYGDDWSELLVAAVHANPVASFTAAADGGTAPEHTVDNSGLHQRYFSSQYDPTGGHKYDVSRNHDLYISRSWNHVEAQSRNEGGDPWWGDHSSGTSKTWPSNHDRRVSRTFPANHTEGTSRGWPPGHHAGNSNGWGPRSTPPA